MCPSCSRMGPRKQPPHQVEVEAAEQNVSRISHKVFLPNNTSQVSPPRAAALVTRGVVPPETVCPTALAPYNRGQRCPLGALGPVQGGAPGGAASECEAGLPEAQEAREREGAGEAQGLGPHRKGHSLAAGLKASSKAAHLRPQTCLC